MPRAILCACLCLFLAAAAPPPAASGAAAAVGGRWNIVFVMPQGAYETPVEFAVGEGGSVTATILGPLGTFRITDTKGVAKGNALRLTANTSWGRLKLQAVVEGDRLKGRYAPAGLASLFFKGELRGLRDRTHAPRPALETFDAAWSLIEGGFHAPDYGGIDMKGLRQRYRPLAAAARGEGELVSLMRRMLGEFRTSHLDFFATPSITPQLHSGIKQAAPPAPHGISWKQAAPSVGFLSIQSFEDGPGVVARIDQAFAALGGNESLIVDLRGNGGGTLAAAMRLADHILPRPMPVGYFASRQGLIERNLTSIDQLDRSALSTFAGYSSEEFGRAIAEKGALMLTSGGRAPRLYSGKVVILIDEYCFSASEALAGVVKETKAATLIGRKTPGLMLGANMIPIEGGWTLVLPVLDFRTPRGVKVEGRGVEPDIKVKYRDGRDADLAAALSFLRAKS
ncbi:MAG TPA: S41 family peptidase [Allosphingosinicella sp.]|nr:S41 family peptidase [Allosphingosinicella sp.]